MHRKGEPLEDVTRLLAERIMVTDLTCLRLDCAGMVCLSCCDFVIDLNWRQQSTTQNINKICKDVDVEKREERLRQIPLTRSINSAGTTDSVLFRIPCLNFRTSIGQATKRWGCNDTQKIPAVSKRTFVFIRGIFVRCHPNCFS
jgi:hypothetical protein